MSAPASTRPPRIAALTESLARLLIGPTGGARAEFIAESLTGAALEWTGTATYDRAPETIAALRAIVAEWDAAEPAPELAPPYRLAAGMRGVDNAPVAGVVDSKGRAVANCGMGKEGGRVARRVVDCMNGCAGIANPAAVPSVLASLVALVGEADLGEVDLSDDDIAMLADARAAIAAAGGQVQP